MRIALLPALLGAGALLAADPARAEDFTGFYAGVNAGYAFGRGGGTRAAPPPRGGVGTAASEKGADGALPPSAAEAARRLPSARTAPGLPR